MCEQVTFQDLLAGDAQSQAGISWLNGSSESHNNEELIISVDGKSKGGRRRWAIGLHDDITGEGIFTGGLFHQSPSFLNRQGEFSHSTIELMAAIAGIEWAICKHKKTGAKRLTVVCDHISWVNNYEDLRAGRVVCFKAVGYEECLFKLMVYITRACSFFDKVTIIHKKYSHHSAISATDWAPDVVSIGGLTCNVTVDPMHISYAWCLLCPVVKHEQDMHKCSAKVVFSTQLYQ